VNRPPALPALLMGLYAAQGVPYGFFTLALPVVLRDAGWSLTAISFMQILGLPWALKFIWAPWFDKTLTHHVARRRWLLHLQVSACALALLAAGACAWWPAGTAAANEQTSLKLLGLFVLMLGFNTLASTQDIITDGLAVRVLNAQARGWANGIQVGAYRFGMILGGGALLWLFARMGWATMLLGMAAMLALTTWPVWRWPAHIHDTDETHHKHAAPDAAHGLSPILPKQAWRQRLHALTLAWWARATAPGMRTCLVLVVCYRFGDQMISGLIAPFLHDQAVGTETVALMKGGAGSATSLLGAILGGWWLMQVTRRQALLYAGCAQALTFLLYGVVAMGHGGINLLWTATLLEGLLSTLATVALFAWMMDAADPDHASADYTLMASVGVVVIGVAGVLGAAMADWLGYAPVFALGAGLCVLGTWIMVRHQDRHPVHERVAAAW